jgi:hypothetical protein
MKINLILAFLLVAVAASGCTGRSQPPEPASNAQLQSLAAEIPPENIETISGITQVANGEYPTSPEGVVQAFLATYDVNPQEALAYLTTGAQTNFNASLLQFNQTIEGFTIDQAAVNPDLPGAFIGVAIQSSGSETRRDFTLTKENNQWKIETISAPAG